MLGNVDVAGQHDYQAMADIADFCENETKLHRAAKRQLPELQLA